MAYEEVVQARVCAGALSHSRLPRISDCRKDLMKRSEVNYLRAYYAATAAASYRPRPPRFSVS